MLALRPTRRHLRRLRHERPDVAMMLAFGAALAILSDLPALLGIEAGKEHRTIVIAMTANARAARDSALSRRALRRRPVPTWRGRRGRRGC